MSGIIVTVIVLFVAVVGISFWRKKEAKPRIPFCAPTPPTNEEITLGQNRSLHCSLEYRRSCASDSANDDFLLSTTSITTRCIAANEANRQSGSTSANLHFLAGDRAETPMHTGTGRSAEITISSPLIEAAIGVKQNNVNYWAYDKARDILFVKDARIFVHSREVCRTLRNR